MPGRDRVRCAAGPAGRRVRGDKESHRRRRGAFPHSPTRGCLPGHPCTPAPCADEVRSCSTIPTQGWNLPSLALHGVVNYVLSPNNGPKPCLSAQAACGPGQQSQAPSTTIQSTVPCRLWLAVARHVLPFTTSFIAPSTFFASTSPNQPDPLAQSSLAPSARHNSRTLPLLDSAKHLPSLPTTAPDGPCCEDTNTLHLASSHAPLTLSSLTAPMLELQLPNPMPHAVPRGPPLDFYHPSRPFPKMDTTTARQIQLPMPMFNPPHQLDTMRTSQRHALTPSADFPGSAVRVVSLPSTDGAGQEYGYQLPAIGNSRKVTSQSPPQPQTQRPVDSLTSQQPVQTVAQRKISANLRVPTTISTPQEGLPQLAAEVSDTPSHLSVSYLLT